MGHTVSKFNDRLNAGPSRWPALELARQTLIGSRIINVTGNNLAFTTEEFVTPGGAFNELAVAQIHNITSTSLDDTAIGGSGVVALLVEGIDADGHEIVEPVIMFGTDIIPTVNAFLWINRLTVVNVGTPNGGAKGTITATAAVDLTTTILIDIGATAAHSTIYKVPREHTAYLFDDTIGLRSGSASMFGSIEHKGPSTSAAWQLLTMFSREGSVMPMAYAPARVLPLAIPGGNFIGVRATTSTAGNIFVNYTLALIREEA